MVKEIRIMQQKKKEIIDEKQQYVMGSLRKYGYVYNQL
jgi:hypothetical protein